MALAVTAFGANIDISTGVAAWQVFVPGNGEVAAVSVSPNGSWAPAPTGSSWVSYDSVGSTSCVVGQTPGNGCANTLVNPGGDTWAYTLTVSAAALGATNGSLSFVFGGDDSVNLFAGTTEIQAFSNSLNCSDTPTSTSAGSSNPYTCNTSIPFNAADLNPDGSFTLTAYVFNHPIIGCGACGNPTGFVLGGALTSGAAVSSAPEPTTFGLLAMTAVAGWALRRKRWSSGTSTSEHSAD